MIFSTWAFGLFFVTVCGIYWSLRTCRGQHLLLLAASYFFYMCWNPWMISMIIGITLFDYGVGIFLHRATDERARRLFLIASLVANIGLLAVFKYTNFFILSAHDFLDALGLHTSLHALAIILPVGISFHTFQTMSYTVDVYRRRVQPARSLLEFALFVAFFPQLVAGPIVIAADFLPQMATRKKFEWSRLESGIVLFMVGLTKKLLIADALGSIADPVFAAPQHYSTPDLWVAMLAYGGQILGDFAGYTDMAIATARIMGFDLRPNFASPYLALGMSDFWRRWHISLSSWLRDFLYIPLGGSRGGVRLTYRNLMLTMLIGGLWHGASWTFVVWGGLHGAALIVERMFTRRTEPNATRAPSMPLARIVAKWAVTFLVVHVAWIFFRCQPLVRAGTIQTEPATVAMARAVYFVQHLFVPAHVLDPHWLPNKLLALLLIGLMMLLQIYDEWVRRGGARLRLPAPLAGVGYALWILALVIFSPAGTNPFIYFQF